MRFRFAGLPGFLLVSYGKSLQHNHLVLVSEFGGRHAIVALECPVEVADIRVADLIHDLRDAAPGIPDHFTCLLHLELPQQVGQRIAGFLLDVAAHVPFAFAEVLCKGREGNRIVERERYSSATVYSRWM